MNTSKIGGSNAPYSYNPLTSNQKKSTTEEVLDLNKNTQNNTSANTDNIVSNRLVKSSIGDILSLNNYKGFLGVAKQSIQKLDSEIQSINIKDESNKKNIENIGRAISSAINTTYSGESIFNQQVNFSTDGKKDIYMNMQIKKPSLDSIDDAYEAQIQIQNIMQDINQVESKVNAKIDKQISSIDHTDIKEKKEFEQKRVDEYVYKADDFQDIAGSEAIQKELLWLLR